MGNEEKTNKNHGDSGPPEGAIPAADQRRNRGGSSLGGKTPGDEQRRTVAESDTSGGSPMDPADQEFLKKSD
jgi:hypothetical protein